MTGPEEERVDWLIARIRRTEAECAATIRGPDTRAEACIRALGRLRACRGIAAALGGGGPRDVEAMLRELWHASTRAPRGVQIHQDYASLLAAEAEEYAAMLAGLPAPADAPGGGQG